MEIEDGVNSYPILVRATSIKKYIQKSKLQTSDSISEFLNEHVKDLIDKAIKICKHSKMKRLKTQYFELNPKGEPEF